MKSLYFTVSKIVTNDTDKHGVSEDQNKKITSAMMKMQEMKN